jgi:choline dehydrogenase-like flavoprotein
MRGNAADYDEWAAGGARGWSYRDILPYFIRSEDNERGADDYHGVGGPLHVSDSRANNPVVDAYLEAAVQAGHVPNADFNGAAQTGVGRHQLTQHNGMRWSTADAFLSLMSPQSRDQVSLRSAAPHAAPRIFHNYLHAEDDRRSMVAPAGRPGDRRPAREAQGHHRAVRRPSLRQRR